MPMVRVLAAAMMLALLGCQSSPAPAAPAPTAVVQPPSLTASTTVMVVASPVSMAPLPVPSPSPSAATRPAGSPSPATSSATAVSSSPSPAAASESGAQARPVIQFEQRLPYMDTSYLLRGVVDSRGARIVTAPVTTERNVPSTPPSPELAARLNALADRLAPFSMTVPARFPCTIRFEGLGQASATGPERDEIAKMAGC
jgi:hypothetical protein